MKLFLCCIPYDSGKSGISVYIRNVVRSLVEQSHELTLAVEPDAINDFSQYPVKLKVMPKCFARPLFSMLYCLFLLPFVIKKEKYDRIIILAANRRMLAFKCKAPVTAVVHDLSQFFIPVKYDCFRMLYVKQILPYYLRRIANDVAAISESTREALIKYWKIPPEKIFINYNGINRSNLPAGTNDASKKVVMYVSRIESPGKNHSNLIRAWNLLPSSIAKEYQLVFVGQDWSGAEQVHHLADKSPYKNSIEFAGFVSKEQLYDLYAHSSLCVFPSLYEGFGLSLVEAMYSGLVCACSNNSSLGEIASGAALTFDPAVPGEIAKAIEQALTDIPLRIELREKGLHRAELFDWNTHAAELVKPHNTLATVLGVTFSTCSMNKALRDLSEMIHDGKKHFCAFINADCLNQAFSNSQYRELLSKADHVWPDGAGVEIAAKYLHTPVRENVNGTDMLPLLCQKGWRIYLLGAGIGVAEEAAECLKREYSQANIVGCHNGFFSKSEIVSVIESINRTQPDILLVAMGVPRQEQWIVDNLSQLDCKVAIGVGGLFDFASHRIPRAPLWIRRCRMEWSFRLYQEPFRLFKRYIIGNPLFLYRVWRYGRTIPKN